MSEKALGVALMVTGILLILFAFVVAWQIDVLPAAGIGCLAGMAFTAYLLKRTGR